MRHSVLAGRVLAAASFVLLAGSLAACGPTASSANSAAGSQSVATTIVPPPAIPPSSGAPATGTLSGSAPGTTPPRQTPPSPQTTEPAQPGNQTLGPGQVNTAGMPLLPPDAVRLSPDGRTLTFTLEQSGCQLFTAAATQQTDAGVVVTVTNNVTVKPGQMCPMIIREVSLSVGLNSPLGSRTVTFQEITKHA